MLRMLVCMIVCNCQLAVAMVLPNTQECSECHFPSRTHVEKKFPTGFGRWENSQCFGCHAELTEVATNYIQGKQDPRFSSLPISDDRINRMERDPLPYLNAALDPITTGGSLRTNAQNLTNFLRRPHGHCSSAGVCSAPLMMAYPGLEKPKSFNPKDPKDINNSELGRNLFQEKCSACHTSSDPSRYNTTAMSLFSADWIFNYANNTLSMGNANRKMPKVSITQEESQYLHAYFHSVRLEKEAEVDALAKKYIANFENKNTSLPVTEINYMWQKFWRDGSCVHCHSIGGRATEKFETSTQGIVTWLKNNDPQHLVDRLITRHAEQQVGIGAEKPGMPMTGEPLSFTAITLLSTWINMGCPDQDFTKFCAAKVVAKTP